jgi:hypothetical protein
MLSYEIDLGRVDIRTSTRSGGRLGRVAAGSDQELSRPGYFLPATVTRTRPRLLRVERPCDDGDRSWRRTCDDGGAGSRGGLASVTREGEENSSTAQEDESRARMEGYAVGFACANIRARHRGIAS